MIGRAAQAWRRRYWRPDAAALAAYADLRPITVVTGGSEGIGHAIAAAFLAHGHHILLIARNPATLSHAATTLAAPGRVSTLSLDVTAPDATSCLDAWLAERRAYCDVLVNSAAMGATGDFAHTDPEKLEQIVALNVAALSRLCRHVLPGMLVRGRGGILNVASLGGYVPGPYQAAYYASKAYVLSLTEAIAHETSGHGVRVAVLAPGTVNTRFHARMGGTESVYRRLLPAAPPQWIGWMAVQGFRLGTRLVLPDPLTATAMLAVRALPHRVSLPLVAFLLKPRALFRR